MKYKGNKLFKFNRKPIDIKNTNAYTGYKLEIGKRKTKGKNTMIHDDRHNIKHKPKKQSEAVPYAVMALLAMVTVYALIGGI